MSEHVSNMYNFLLCIFSVYGSGFNFNSIYSDLVHIVNLKFLLLYIFLISYFISIYLYSSRVDWSHCISYCVWLCMWQIKLEFEFEVRHVGGPSTQHPDRDQRVKKCVLEMTSYWSMCPQRDIWWVCFLHNFKQIIKIMLEYEKLNHLNMQEISNCYFN